MKKITKAIAALSAAAMIPLSSGMTAFAYKVDETNYSDYYKNDNTYHFDYDTRKDTPNGPSNGSSGYGWNEEYYQKEMPILTKDFFDTQTTIPLSLPNVDGYANTGANHVLGLLSKSAAISPAIADTKKYVDKLYFKKAKCGIMLEYHNNSWDDIFVEDEETDPYLSWDDIIEEDENEKDGFDPLYDYCLKMIDEQSIKDDVLKNFSMGTYKLDSTKMYITGDIYLKNYYIAGMYLSSNDGSASFDTPVLERNPDGIGFRTRIRFRAENPYYDRYVSFGYAPGKRSFNILNNVNINYVCGGIKTLETKLFASSVTLDLDKTVDHRNFYTCIITGSSPYHITLLEGNTKKDFLNNKFFAAKLDGNVLNICLGKKNTGISAPGWTSSSKNQQLDAMLKCGYGYTLKRSTWVSDQLDQVVKVRFYRDANTSSMGTLLAEYSPDQVKELLKSGKY